MNIRDRLMSRASVAVMAAFAPDGLPPGAERVDEAAAGSGGGGDDLGGLSAEEQALFDAMRGATDAGDKGNVDPSGDAGGDDGGEADPDADADGEGEAPAPADKEAGPPIADGADKRPPPKTINYGRHQKEMAKAQKDREDLQAQLEAAKAERQKEREERMRLDERAKLLLEAINSRPPPAAAAPAAAVDKDPEPDAEIDPIGHSQWKIRQLEQVVTELQSGRKQQQELSAAEQAERAVYGEYSAEIEAAAGADATFADAFSYLRDTRYRELGFIYAGIDINDAEQCAQLTPAQQKQLSDGIKRSFYNEQIMTAEQSKKSGRSVAAVVRNLAVARGWAPKAPEPAAGDPPPAGKKGNGAAPPAAPAARAAAPTVSVTDQLEQIRANQRDARSLSDAGGAPGGDMTLERLMDMPEEDFAEFLAVNKAKVDRMMGKVPQ